MSLSALQKFILLECSSSKSGRANRSRLVKFYSRQGKQPKGDLITKIITKSLERLIDRGLVTGYGQRTSRRWFIQEIRLTPQGKKQTKKLLGEQMSLPLIKNRQPNKVRAS